MLYYEYYRAAGSFRRGLREYKHILRGVSRGLTGRELFAIIFYYKYL